MYYFIIGISAFLLGVLTSNFVGKEKNESKIESLNKKINRNSKMLNILEKWIYLMNNHKSICDYLIERKMNRIAIYGKGVLGELLISQLHAGNIPIEYVIENKKKAFYSDVQVLKLNDELAPVDVIIVTAISDFSSIRESLLKRDMQCEIISLEDIIYEING